MIVLHVDRSRFSQKVIRQSGQATGVDFLSCDSIKEALEILNKYAVELIITGKELSDGSAKDLLLKLQESVTREIPVIMMTSSDDLDTRNEFFKLGVVDFLSKSDYTPERLQEHIDSFVKKDSLMEELSKASIAILDDSAISIQALSSILKIHNIEKINTFTDPEELLNCESSHDIYFIDMILPRISGGEVVLRIREKYPHAVILVVSALDKINTMAHILESGADDYIIKPFSARLLTARLKSNYRHYLNSLELERKKDELEKIAVTDSLTGAKSHRYIMQRLSEFVAHAERKKGEHAFCLLLLDLDHFKKVNDHYGHLVGDEVLKSLATQFIEGCRAYDVFGRYGGEEFLLILPDTALEDALPLCDRMRQQFNETNIPGMRNEHFLSFSGGLVEWYGEEVPELLKKVDSLLYEAKSEGRNRIKY